MIEEIKDEELIKLYLGGDLEAFEKLLKKYLAHIYNFVYRLVLNQDDARDVSQEVFIRVWKNLKHFKKEKKFKSWLFSIAHNAAVDFLRKKKNINFSELEREGSEENFEETIEDENFLPSDLAIQAEEKKYVESLLATLPENYREIILLYYQEDLTFSEISGILNKPLNTVKSQYRRGMMRLKKELKDRLY